MEYCAAGHCAILGSTDQIDKVGKPLDDMKFFSFVIPLCKCKRNINTSQTLQISFKRDKGCVTRGDGY